jgi:hypothetical protein
VTHRNTRHAHSYPFEGYRKEAVLGNTFDMERDIDCEWRDIVAQLDDPARPAETMENGWAQWAVVAGLMSLAPAISMSTLPVALPLAAAALALGVVALRVAPRRGGIGRRRAIAGITMACVPIAMVALAAVFTGIFAVLR